MQHQDFVIDDDQTRWQEELYQHLHSHPELSMVEHETAAEITRRLDSFGFTTQQVGGGVVGVLANGEGRSILVRADMDALPVAEQTGLPYASTVRTTDQHGAEQPAMHACGHDMHVTALLGAASWLAGHRDQWQGTFVALFQPGEETAQGARSMVDDGLVEKLPKVDLALAQHVLTRPESGHVGITEGPFLSTATSMRITVFGTGSHGSMPHLGVDPIVLTGAIITRLQGIVSRELAPGTFGVVTVGSVQAGSAANIIPASATLLLNFRAYSDEVRDQLVAAVERIVRAECQASRSPQEPTFELYDAYPLTDNDADLTARVRAGLEAHFGAERVETLPPQTASEDFSTIPDALGVPYCYWGFGGFTAGQDVKPNHNPGFAPSMQPTLRTGTEAVIAACLALFSEED